MLEYLFTLLKMTTPKIILTDEGFDMFRKEMAEHYTENIERFYE